MDTNRYSNLEELANRAMGSFPKRIHPRVLRILQIITTNGPFSIYRIWRELQKERNVGYSQVIADVNQLDLAGCLKITNTGGKKPTKLCKITPFGIVFGWVNDASFINNETFFRILFEYLEIPYQLLPVQNQEKIAIEFNKILVVPINLEWATRYTKNKSDDPTGEKDHDTWHLPTQKKLARKFILEFLLQNASIDTLKLLEKKDLMEIQGIMKSYLENARNQQKQLNLQILQLQQVLEVLGDEKDA